MAALAQNNEPPPLGAILDLGGQAINHGAAAPENVVFTAALTATDITFAFREDPAFISLGNVTLVDVTTGSLTNLILNGTFALGTVGTPNATDWTYANVFGAGAGGTVETGACGGGLATCWFDGAIQAYDAIDQFVTLVVGDQYRLSFLYSDDGGLTTFSDLSTNGQPGTGGNGVDILAYAQAGLPPPGNVPEPSTLVSLGTGLLAFAGVVRSRRSK
jgi:hypothetical protein